MNYTKDIIDEALKVVLLNDTDNLNEDNLQRILNGNYTSKMTSDQKEKMLQKLKAKTAPTFGTLLQSSIDTNNLNSKSFSEKIRLPFSLLERLINDTIVANDIPVVLMKKLLHELNIPIDKAATAIFRTFEKISSKKSDSNYGALLQPSFRKNAKSSSDFGGLGSTNNSELFENEEALNKYLEHLKELT